MSDSQILVYAAEWCGDCRRAKRFLMQHEIPFQWINIDQDKEAEQVVLKLNRGMRSVPTLIFPDGTILVEPSNSQLAQKLCIELA